jgi:hypothetical protein
VPVSQKAYADAKRLQLDNELMDTMIEQGTVLFDQRRDFSSGDIIVSGYRLKMKRDSGGNAIVDRIALLPTY